jgi:hypothetical protein
MDSWPNPPRAGAPGALAAQILQGAAAGAPQALAGPAQDLQGAWQATADAEKHPIPVSVSLNELASPFVREIIISSLSSRMQL